MGQRIDFIESGKKATTMRFGLQVGTSLATAHSTTTLATSNTILPNNRQARGFHRPLTQAKKNKRRRLGLCLYCGRSGHFVAKVKSLFLCLLNQLVLMTSNSLPFP